MSENRLWSQRNFESPVGRNSAAHCAAPASSFPTAELSPRARGPHRARRTRPRRGPAQCASLIAPYRAARSAEPSALRCVRGTAGSAASVSPDQRAAEIEAIIQAGLDGVLVDADGAEEHEGERGYEGAAAEIVILIFDLGGKVRREHVFHAGTDGVAVAAVAIEGKGQRNAAKGQALLVVRIGIAALGVDQRRTPGNTGAAGHRAKRATFVGVDEAARKNDAVVAAAEPAVLAFH